MTVPPLPSPVRSFPVVCRVGQFVMDGTDADRAPDLAPVGGTVEVKPDLTRQLRVTTPDGPRVTDVDPLTFTIDPATGQLVHPDGGAGVLLLDPSDPHLDPQGWTYTATVKPAKGRPWVVTFGAPAEGGTVDLGALAQVAPSPGEPQNILQQVMGAAASAASSAVQAAASAVTAAENAAAVTWANLSGKPTTFPPAAHSHAWSTITSRPSTFPPSAHTHLWADLTDKPATFAPSAHGHAVGDVTGLQAALDGKAATVHGHAWADITSKPATFTPSAHSHDVANVTGLQTALDGKAAAVHGHSISDVSGLEAALAAGGGGGAINLAGGIYLDSFTGTDDERLTAAIAAQKATPGMPPIILANRTMNFNMTRALYSGCKIIGPYPTGQKNPELSSGNYVGPRVVLGSGITSGASSWWVGTGSIYNVYMADFSVQGSQGASRHQFLDQASGTLYACEFRSLSFNFMRGIFGLRDRTCLMTQVNLTGTWTLQNLWDSQLTVGGSDNQFWMNGYVNMGPSSSSAQTGSYGGYMLNFVNLTNTSIGYIYLSALNGWRGLRQYGTASEIAYFGGVYEGYKPTRQNGLLSGPAPGTLFRVDGGAAALHGVKFGQGMDNPDPAENGLVQVNGGEVTMVGCNFYGANMATANAIHHTGGRLSVLGATKRTSESWPNRPRVATAFSAGSGASAFYCPDQSVALV